MWPTVSSGALAYFFPSFTPLPVVADLKGLENIRESVPTTLITRKLMLALSMFFWSELTAAEAIAVVVMFERMLRTVGAPKVRAVDIICSSRIFARHYPSSW